MDSERFRPALERAVSYSDGAKGGRPPFDPVLMFRILIIQAQNNLSDERSEFLINDRLSFMRFWACRSATGYWTPRRFDCSGSGWFGRRDLGLFRQFDAVIRDAGYIAMSGQLIDATVVAAPKQRNTEEEKTQIRKGLISEAWKAKPAKLWQKDRDAL